MKGGEPKTQQPEQDPANLSEQELSSNQEATAVPWLCGERKVAVRWVCPVLNMFAKEGSSAKK